MRRFLLSCRMRIGTARSQYVVTSNRARAYVAGSKCAATPARIKRTGEDRRFFWDVVAPGARPGVPGGLLSAWWLWERIAQRLWPAFVAPGSPHGLLRIRTTAYRGRPIDLPDSTHIDRGATVCELHCANDALLNFSRCSSAVYAAGRDDLRAIANWLIQYEAEVAALYGLTLLGAAAARLGFYRRSMSLTWRAKAERLFMNGLLALYSVDGVARLKRGRTLIALPEEIWMSRQDFLRKYGAPNPVSAYKAVSMTSHLHLAKPSAR